MQVLTVNIYTLLAIAFTSTFVFASTNAGQSDPFLTVERFPEPDCSGDLPNFWPPEGLGPEHAQRDDYRDLNQFCRFHHRPDLPSVGCECVGPFIPSQEGRLGCKGPIERKFPNYVAWCRSNCECRFGASGPEYDNHEGTLGANETALPKSNRVRGWRSQAFEEREDLEEKLKNRKFGAAFYNSDHWRGGAEGIRRLLNWR